MKTRVWIQGSLVLASLAAANLVLGETEQWLQYRTTREPQGYRWIDLTNTPPAEINWPKLGSNALYGQWKTKLDPKGGRWICVDRTLKSGPCDRLFIDSNGNGRLDDETPLKATRRDEYMSNFEPVRLAFKGEDGPLTYHLICHFYQFGTNRAQLLTGSGCVYEGKVNLAGKKRLLQLVDNTVNGVFNDISPNPYDSDRVVIDGQDGSSRYLGRLLEVDNQLFRVEVAADGACIKAQLAQNVVLGAVRFPETISEFTAVGTNGHFVRKPVKGETTLPVGAYRVHAWSIDRKDSNGGSWQLSGSSFSEFSTFTVTAAQPVALDIGEPVRTALQATQNKGEFSFSLRLYGSLGESIQIMRGKEQAPAPQLQIASVAGALRTTNNFQYG
jgi:hypothetical protein